MTNDQRLGILISRLDEFVVVLCDAAGRFSSWHPGVLAQFGYTQDEFIGQRLDILFPPEDRNTDRVDHELADAAQNGRTSDTCWLVKKSGEHLMVEGVTIALSAPDGTLLGFGKVLRDVTPLISALDSGRALAGALQQSNVLIRRWNGAIEHWSAGCERLYGWTAKEAAGKIADGLLHTVFPSSSVDVEKELLESGSWQGELRQSKKDGSPVFVSAQWVLLHNEKAEGPLVIATHTDITARLQMQHDLESANDRMRRMTHELARSNEDLEEFARIASHDLRAPLTTTRWLTDLLSIRHSGELDEEGRTCLQQIVRSLERMAELVDAILTHAQVGHSAISSTEETDTEAALDIAMENLRRDIVAANAQIEHEALPLLAIQPQSLTQLFQNLLGNAIKYRRPGIPPEIKIRARREKSHWIIAVEDNGLGIEEEWKERIFVPLQRRSQRETGSGLGLATCKKIVTRAGGTIWVESKLGVGSTFYFSLPVLR